MAITNQILYCINWTESLQKYNISTHLTVSPEVNSTRQEEKREGSGPKKI